MGYPSLAEVVDIARHGAALTDVGHVLRTRSFVLLQSDASAPLTVRSEEEYFVLLPNVGARLKWSGGQVEAPGNSVVIMPPGPTAASLTGPGTCVGLFTKLPSSLRGVETFGPRDGGAPLRALKPHVKISTAAEPVIHVLDALPNSIGMPRAKLFQTRTMSINWVEYSGPRDRKNLSPHSHADFEQGSLALAGDFVHHFRTPWERDANRWSEDQHVAAGPGTVALIPPGVIHTTEGVGTGRHVLIDIFAPPRDDFIAKGQVLNASAYTAPTDHVR